MRVLIVNSFFYPNEVGGAEKSVRITASELVRLGHEVLVLALSPERLALAVDGIDVHSVPLANIYFPSGKGEYRSTISKLAWHAVDTYNPYMASRVGKVIGEFMPDVIHTNNLSGFSVSTWKVARKMRIPVVHTTRDFYLICPKGTMLKNGSSCARQCRSCKAFSLVRKNTSKSVSHVVGISDFILGRHRLSGFFEGVDSSVIFNPYLPETHKSDVGAMSPMPKSMRVGFIGRLDPVKGIELLLDACKSLIDEGTGISLTIAGEGTKEYEGILRERSQDLGERVRFLGKVDASSFYRDIDLLVVPSVWDEPLGRVVLEAFAYGLPVVATPVGGLPEITTGYAGVVCGQVSALALASSIKTILDRLEREPDRIRDAALFESKKYAPGVIARKYEAVYESVTGVSHG